MLFVRLRKKVRMDKGLQPMQERHLLAHGYNGATTSVARGAVELEEICR
jgi:hypothetical protein